MDLWASHKTLQETRADKFRFSAGTIKPDVVEAHNTDVRILGKLPLKLALHRPVNAFVKDVRLGHIPANEFSNCALTGMALGCGYHHDRLSAGPVVSE